MVAERGGRTIITARAPRGVAPAAWRRKSTIELNSALSAPARVATAEVRTGLLTEAALCGLRLTVGVTFIVHGFGKFGNEGFVGWMSSFGISPEFAFIIALGEFIPGILLVAGVLSRISAGIIAIIMLSAMIVVRGFASFAGMGDESGYEHDLVLFAAALLIAVTGPGRLALARVLPFLPRWLH